MSPGPSRWSSPNITVLRALLNWKLTLLNSLLFLSVLLLSSLLEIFNLRISFIRDAALFLAPIGLIGLLISGFLLVAEKLGLLLPGQVESAKESTLAVAVQQINARIDLLAYEINTITSASLSESGKMVEALEPELQRIADLFFSTEGLARIESDIKEKYGDNIHNGFKISELRSLFRDTIKGLTEQLSVQRVNSNVNLYIGLCFATAGIMALGYVFYYSYIDSDSAIKSQDATQFFLGLIPRITFAVLVETVAFFFLSLYREDRNMIRFFRNEITNYESKFLAMEAAARFGDKAALNNSVKVFTNTERNFIVKKGDRLITEVLRENDERMSDVSTCGTD